MPIDRNHPDYGKPNHHGDACPDNCDDLIYQAALDSGLSDYEAREEAWPQNGPHSHFPDIQQIGDLA